MLVILGVSKRYAVREDAIPLLSDWYPFYCNLVSENNPHPSQLRVIETVRIMNGTNEDAVARNFQLVGDAVDGGGAEGNVFLQELDRQMRVKPRCF